MFYIYKITNKVNKRFYIGQTTDPDQRFKKHMTYPDNRGIKRDLKKHGKDSFIFEILSECETQDRANEIEIDTIIELDALNSYNDSIGGQLSGIIRYCDKCCRPLKFFRRKYNKYDELETEGGDSIVVFRKENGKVTDLKLLCKRDVGGCDNDWKKYDLSLEYTIYVFGTIVRDYNISEEIVKKYIMSDGKFDSYMAYEYFKKK